MNALEGQSSFGYCDHCGIVYALDKMKEQGAIEEPPEIVRGPSVFRRREEGEEDIIAPGERRVEAPGSHWRCPDCELVLTAENEVDLSYLKREHIRELHPNR